MTTEGDTRHPLIDRNWPTDEVPREARRVYTPPSVKTRGFGSDLGGSLDRLKPYRLHIVVLTMILTAFVLGGLVFGDPTPAAEIVQAADGLYYVETAVPIESYPVATEAPVTGEFEGSNGPPVVVTTTQAIPTVAVTPPVDPYAKYAGQPVAHPRRQPDALIVAKVSRYDPALGGTNCFRWGSGTCLSNLANGEDWRTNYEIAIACPSGFAFGTIVEIDGKLWICKDRGGKIVQSRPGVYWVDQLSATGHYPYGFEITAAVWYP